jgi:hypothetical protein
MSTTDRFRYVAWGLTVTIVAVALFGWLFRDLDPTPLLGFAMIPGIAEGSHVGKRATYKVEAVEAERNR